MPDRPPRITLQTQLVLRALVDDPTREMYGVEICRSADLPTGTVHPILARLERFDWVTSFWEDIDPNVEGRPRRRYYRLTPDGYQNALNALARVHTPAPFRTRLGGIVPGEATS